jgi:hypothetical protein
LPAQTGLNSLSRQHILFRHHLPKAQATAASSRTHVTGCRISRSLQLPAPPPSLFRPGYASQMRHFCRDARERRHFGGDGSERRHFGGDGPEATFRWRRVREATLRGECRPGGERFVEDERCIVESRVQNGVSREVEGKSWRGQTTSVS